MKNKTKTAPIHILHTVESAKAYVEENSAKITEEFRSSKEIPDCLKLSPTLKEVWTAGYWLSLTLKKSGASAKQTNATCFALGQKSFYGNVWDSHLLYFISKGIFNKFDFFTL